MLSRALSLATVTLLIGCIAAIPVRAQNLEAGKSASQIFAGTCSACHKSPRGLLRTVPAGSLPGFLRQHYTTSSDMASSLGGFLISNGATDTRVGSKPTEQPKGAKPPEGVKPPEQLDRYGRPVRPATPSQEAARPEAQPHQAARPDTGAPAAAQGHNAKRLARPAEAPDAAKPAVEGQAPAQAAIERGPDGRKLTARQKRGRPGSEEPPKADAAKTDGAKTDTAKTDTAKTDASKEEPAKGESAKDDTSKSETAKVEGGSRPEGSRPSGEGKPDSAKVDAPKDSGGGEVTALRPDPVPPVTPAPKSMENESRPVQTATPSPAASGTGPAAVPEPPAAPPAVTASVPPPPPVAPAGPPAPPISQ
jgi:hypothetical protein